ncbi:hypothetical protein CMUS01_10986 [Colletotrichum musicola]|uniref:Uncharacterized protein n=1 Tax=Colletotrichum musicola TaxID=2175873 RepID=A0A8H6K0A6_9PEZI|nr:hypothetical protein CMUS01_10986 [Colletotrichum musicola]
MAEPRGAVLTPIMPANRHTATDNSSARFVGPSHRVNDKTGTTDRASPNICASADPDLNRRGNDGANTPSGVADHGTSAEVV